MEKQMKILPKEHFKVRHKKTGLFASQDLKTFDNIGHSWYNDESFEKDVRKNGKECLRPYGEYELLVLTEVATFTLSEEDFENERKSA